MDARFVQAHKREARWALWLTLAIWRHGWWLLAHGELAGNYRSAALVRNGLLVTRAAGLYFAVLGAMVKFIYRDISLEDDDAAWSFYRW